MKFFFNMKRFFIALAIISIIYPIYIQANLSVSCYSLLQQRNIVSSPNISILNRNLSFLKNKQNLVMTQEKLIRSLLNVDNYLEKKNLFKQTEYITNVLKTILYSEDVILFRISTKEHNTAILKIFLKHEETNYFEQTEKDLKYMTAINHFLGDLSLVTPIYGFLNKENTQSLMTNTVSHFLIHKLFKKRHLSTSSIIGSLIIYDPGKNFKKFDFTYNYNYQNNTKTFSDEITLFSDKSKIAKNEPIFFKVSNDKMMLAEQIEEIIFQLLNTKKYDPSIWEDIPWVKQILLKSYLLNVSMITPFFISDENHNVFFDISDIIPPIKSILFR